MIRTFSASIVNGHVCQVTYKTAAPSAIKKIHEVLSKEIVAHGGAVYHCLLSQAQDPITLNMHRVHVLKVTDQRAEPHGGFKLKDRSAFYFGMHTGGDRKDKLRFAVR